MSNHAEQRPNPRKSGQPVSRKGSLDPQAAAPRASGRSFPGGGQVRYLLSFVLIFLALYSLYYFFRSGPYLMHYFVWIAASVSQVFNWFDPQVGFQGNMILYKGHPALEIIADCDGLAFVILIAAAVLPFARSAKQKIVGLLVLAPLLLLINWLRIVVLAALYFYYPQPFEFVHLYLFQPVMILIAVLSFMLWIVFSEYKRSGD